jgi:hypothetical protein
MLSYLVQAQIFPAQGARVVVVAHVLPVFVPSLPAPSVVSFGSYHSLRRSFSTADQAERFAAFLRSTFTQGPAHHPFKDRGQLDLL